MKPRLFSVLGAIIGLVIGYPLSYFTLPSGDRPPLAMDGYLTHFTQLVTRRELQLPILVTCIASTIVVAVIGFLVGVLAARNR